MSYCMLIYTTTTAVFFFNNYNIKFKTVPQIKRRNSVTLGFKY